MDPGADVMRDLAAPNLRTMRFEDYAGIRKLASDHAISVPSALDWAHRWRDNPVWQRLGDRSPMGWVLESANGEIVGSMETVPVLYKFRGSDLVSAASALWCVSVPYRGFALQLIDEYFNQSVDLFISTTVGPTAIETLKQLSDPIPVGRWDATSCFIAHRRSFAEVALRKLRIPLASLLSYPASGILRLTEAVSTKRLADPPRGVLFDTATAFDSRFDAFWAELLRQNPERLLAERSSLALSWHFFTALRTGRLWILTASRGKTLTGYCIFNEVASVQGSRSICLVDYQTIDEDLDLLPGFIQMALRRGAAEGFYRLEHAGLALPKFRAFDDHAFYRSPVGTWTFLFRAADPKLDAELHQPQFWDPSAYDGDASLY